MKFGICDVGIGAGVAQSVWCLDYGLDDRVIGVRFPAGAKDFSSILCVQTGSEAHPASCYNGYPESFPWCKARPGRDADHSSLSCAEFKNE
jgi:hypothetical protein